MNQQLILKSILLSAAVISLAVGYPVLRSLSLQLYPSATLISEIGDPNRANPPAAEDGLEDPEKRMDWFMFQRTYPFDKIPDGARRRAHQDALDQAARLRPDAPLANWTSIGPAPTTSAFPNNG